MSCRITAIGFPDALAYPCAMPTASFSWLHVMICGSLPP